MRHKAECFKGMSTESEKEPDSEFSATVDPQATHFLGQNLITAESESGQRFSHRRTSLCRFSLMPPPFLRLLIAVPSDTSARLRRIESAEALPPHESVQRLKTSRLDPAGNAGSPVRSAADVLHSRVATGSVASPARRRAPNNC